ncbi:hypothetical protein ACOSQ2_029009 [Xanthoceras sorbifolium]
MAGGCGFSIGSFGISVSRSPLFGESSLFYRGMILLPVEWFHHYLSLLSSTKKNKRDSMSHDMLIGCRPEMSVSRDVGALPSVDTELCPLMLLGCVGYGMHVVLHRCLPSSACRTTWMSPIEHMSYYMDV